MIGQTFSQRHGVAPATPPVTIRTEAPQWLRDFILAEAVNAHFTVNALRTSLCVLLLESPDPDNWSDGNIQNEVRTLLKQAEWYHVYDFIEEIAKTLWQRRQSRELAIFTQKLNDAFIRKGIGWQLIGVRVEARGEEAFEKVVRSGIVLANSTGRKVTGNELHEALMDISRRPEPDVSGAVQHAIAALECVVRDVTSDKNGTLGALLNKNPNILPPPLDKGLTFVWGYASDRARHLREEHPPTFEEAELIVGLSGTLITYLMKKALPPQPFSGGL